VNLTKRLIALAGCAIVLASGSALAQRSAGENIDDSTIISKTKFALIADEDVGAGDINVEAYKGRVALIGFVDSESERKAAIASAKNIDGVAAIDDAMVVLKVKRSFGRVIDDETLYGKVKLKLADAEGLGEAADVVVMVRDGHVLLGGFVDSKDTIKDIGKAVREIDDIKKVHNLLAPKKG
jgi:osmotically-inducible protein OsmY